MSKRTVLVQTPSGPVLVDNATLLGRLTGRGSKPSPKPTPKPSPPEPSAADLAEVDRIERQREATAAAYFERVNCRDGIEFSADESPRRVSSSNRAAGERLEDAAKRLGVDEGELTEALLGRAKLASVDGKLYVRSADLRRLEPSLRRSGTIPDPAAQSQPAEPKSETFPEMTPQGIVQRTVPEKVETEPAEPKGGELRASANKRTRLGKPQRWSSRPWAAR